jgi:hypothetical protein
MPPPQAYRTLYRLVEKRVNNRRTRAIMRGYLQSRPDPNFHTLKYRKYVRAIARHAHLKLDVETQKVLFHPRDKWNRFETGIYDAFRRAHYEARAVFELPLTIAEGLAARHKISRHRLLDGFSSLMTVREKQRLQRSATKAGIDFSDAMNTMTLTRLSSYLLGMSEKEQLSQESKISAAFQNAARKAARLTAQRYGNVALVLDCSQSSRGSAAKANRPLAIALGATALFPEISDHVSLHWTTAHEGHSWQVSAKGPTDLANPLLDAMALEPDHIVIVSDGYENGPTGGVSEIVRLWRDRLNGHHKTTLTHMNPVFDPDTYAVRSLSAYIPAIGVRNVEDIPLAMLISRFANGEFELRQLVQFLQHQSQQFLAA